MLPKTKAEAASIDKLMSKSIYFAGKYKGKMKSGGNGVGATLSMSQYSSYDSGKEVGNFVFKAWGGRVQPKGTLTRIGKNKYRCKNFCEKGTTLTFTVKFWFVGKLRFPKGEIHQGPCVQILP